MKKKKKKKKKDIAIIVAAKGIDPAWVDRFKDSIVKSNPKHSVDIMIGQGKDKKFYKTRIINHLIRKCMPLYKVIIQTDIDLLIPPLLIDRTYRALMNQPNNGFHHHLRYIEPEEVKGKAYKDYPWYRWVNLKSSFCSGCWNGMLSNTWAKSRGYNEDMFAWGSEDTEFYNRSRRLGIRWINCKDLGLVHISHPRRTKRRAQENFKLGNMYSDKTNWLTGDLHKK